MRPSARLAILCGAFIAGTFGCGDETVPTTSVPTTGAATDPVAITSIITVPGNAMVSSTKTWVDDATKRLYLTDVSNAGVDVIDARTLAYVGRVPGFIGTGAAAATSGPNSIVFTGDGKAWVSDGIAVVRVVDLTTLTVTATISTAIAACGTTCQRTNEISYDPEHKIIFVQNPSPLAAGVAIDTYGTFISAVSPYPVLGTITFADRRGQEAPLYDASQHRFLTAVSGRRDTTVTPALYYDQYVAVIDPTVIPFVTEKKYTIDCFALGIGTFQGNQFGINDPSLAPGGKMVIPGCGKALLMNATTGAVTPVLQVGGGNETWYNTGDGRFYVTGADITNGVNSLGVIKASTGTWLQSVPALQATNPAAFAETNTIFAAVQVTAAQVTTPSTDNSACVAVGGPAGKGCILVFHHVANPSAGLNAMPKVVPVDLGVVADDD